MHSKPKDNESDSRRSADLFDGESVEMELLIAQVVWGWMLASISLSNFGVTS